MMKKVMFALIMSMSEQAFSEDTIEVGPEKILDLFDALKKGLSDGTLVFSNQLDCQFMIDRGKGSIEITYEPKQKNIKIGPFVIEGAARITTRYFADGGSNSRTVDFSGVSLDGATRYKLELWSSTNQFPQNGNYLRTYVAKSVQFNDFVGEVFGLKPFQQTGQLYDCGYYHWNMNGGS